MGTREKRERQKVKGQQEVKGKRLKVKRELLSFPFLLSPLTCYSLLAIAVMGPMLLPGFILTLDMVFTPKIPAPTEISNIYILQWVQHILNFVLPGQVIQKILIFTVLFLCGYGAHRLVLTSLAEDRRLKIEDNRRKVEREQKSVRAMSTSSRVEAQDSKLKARDFKTYSIPAYFGGILYVLNPFTYERWMAGQYLLLAGYALLPFLVKSLIGFGKEPTRKKGVIVALWYTAVALVSIHMFVLACILGAIFLIIHLVAKSNEPQYKKKLATYSGLTIIITLILNSYWLIATLRGTSSTAQTIDAIGSADLQAFATASSDQTGLFFNVLSMYGFWLEDDGRFALPNTNLFLWIGGFILIASLVVLGMRTLDLFPYPTSRHLLLVNTSLNRIFSKMYLLVYLLKRSSSTTYLPEEVRMKRGMERGLLAKKRDLIAISLIITGFLALLMALGVNAPVTGNLTKWVIENVPFMSGFRDSQKFSALIVLAYVYFAARGLNHLLSRSVSKDPPWKTWKTELLKNGVLILPIIYVPIMLVGFAGQLKPVHYPDSWYSFNAQLEQDVGQGKVLFLPWHQYMSYDFTRRVIASPAPQFFNAKVLSSQNAELGGIVSASQSSDTIFVEQQILNNAGINNAGERLAEIGVEYVLLSEGKGYEQYGFLAGQTDLKEISEQPGLTVYRNEAYK